MDAIEKKNMYEAKAGYVEKIMRENRKIDTLSEEQHILLYELSALRHEMHTRVKHLWHGNDTAIFNEIDCDSVEDGIREEVEHVFGRAPFERKDLMGADVWWELSGKEIADDEKREDDRLDWYDEFYDAIIEINREIETFLGEIDKEHGTRYCPTGYARLFSSYKSKIPEIQPKDIPAAPDQPKPKEPEKDL